MYDAQHLKTDTNCFSARHQSSDTMVNLMWANTFNFGYVTHDLVGIIVCNTQTLHG